jgi:hypothetical protein
LVFVFMAPSWLFILPLLRMARLLLRSVLDMLLLEVPLVVWSVVVVGVPALGMLEGLPVWAPGEVPGATVWARAALVANAKAVARNRVAFILTRSKERERAAVEPPRSGIRATASTV